MKNILPIPAALPSPAISIAQTLRDQGYDALFVGGAVRDILLNTKAKDIDLATDATPDQVRRIFKRTYVVGTGERHGTIGVMGSDNEGYEVTTFREDIATDGRHATVRFARDIETDLARRDFTINAMALRPVSTDQVELIDPFGGQEDLRAGLLRTVGNPEDRFREDYLRIMRLYRFASRLGFTVDPGARQAARDLRSGLAGLSKERIQTELWKILGDTVVPGRLTQIIGVMQEDGILTLVMPELDASLPDRLVSAEAILNLLPAQTSSARALFRLALLVAHLPEPGLKKLSARLGMANDATVQLVELVKSIPTLRQLVNQPLHAPYRHAEAGLRHVPLEASVAWLAALDKPTLDSALLRNLVNTADAAMTEARANGYPLKPSQMAINGETVMKVLNIPPGPMVGRIMAGLFKHVLDCPEANTAEQLQAEALSLMVSLKNVPGQKR